MTNRTPPVRVAVSACLLGQTVRYDGGHQHCRTLVDALQLHCELVPLCPEVELGMGVPREPIELTSTPVGIRLLGRTSRIDWTDRMRDFARRRATELVEQGISGFVLKSKSPSCGIRHVKLFDDTGEGVQRGEGPLLQEQPLLGGLGDASSPRSWKPAGVGLFAETLMSLYPDVPLEDEWGMEDERRRAAFLEACRRSRR